tara:strand:+ start:1500 stop:1913 length:414 start_codon:yes stop_codon:yes gene_type:complete
LNDKISNKDKKDWENFLSNKEKLFDKDNNSNIKKKINTRTFDFHGYSLNDANKKIENLIQESYDSGINKLIIVTGKGIHSDNEKDPYKSDKFGILKNSLPEFIKNNKELLKMINSISEANVIDGGSGAFYIFLKKKL